MALELSPLIDTSTIKGQLEELYSVCLELVVLTKMWEELSVGPRNANDAYAIGSIDERVRSLRKERASIHKFIHELPEKRQ